MSKKGLGQNQFDYFLKSYRLYIQDECKEFFKVIKSKDYKERSKISPIQFVMKIGSGVHRGLGVQILDQKLEKIYLEDY